MKLVQTSYTVRAAATFAAVLLLAWPAQAQWQWRDDTGRRVFSDQAPPPSVPESAIVSRPKAAKRALSQEPPAVAIPEAPSDKRTSGPVPRPEADLKAEAELQKKVKAEEARVAALRADNCQRARRALITVNSGMRIATVNDKGEREFLDEKAIAAERQRLESMVRSDCAPG